MSDREARALYASHWSLTSNQRLAPPEFMSAAENEASSSCDEYDDEDLTDGSSSDEDLSDIGELAGVSVPQWH